MAVVGIGVDVVDIARFGAVLARHPRLGDRLFTANERLASPSGLAARFAAKEAVAKALGAPRGLHWHDCEVCSAPDGRPSLAVTGTVLAAAASLGIASWHVSLSHDGGLATAMVVAET